MTTKFDTNISASQQSPAKAASSLFQSLAGNKLRQKLGSQLNESSAVGTSEFAKKQLQKLGWQEGQGLGKRRQGMASHIQVTKRAEGLGLGNSAVDPAIQQSLTANDWWKHSAGDTLAKLAANRKIKKSQKKKEKKGAADEQRRKVYTDEQLFAATGGARFGMRAQTQQHGKWKRAEGSSLEKEEVEAKKKLEWDGISAPVVVMTESSNKKRKTDTIVDDESSKSKKKRKAKDETDEDRGERRKRKKEKKHQKRLNEESESLLTGKTTTTFKKSKKAKKQKMSKD